MTVTILSRKGPGLSGLLALAQFEGKVVANEGKEVFVSAHWRVNKAF